MGDGKKRPIDALFDLRDAVATWAGQPQNPMTDEDFDLMIAWWQCFPDLFEKGIRPEGFMTRLSIEAISKLEQRRAEIHGGSIA